MKNMKEFWKATEGKRIKMEIETTESLTYVGTLSIMSTQISFNPINSNHEEWFTKKGFRLVKNNVAYQLSDYGVCTTLTII